MQPHLFFLHDNPLPTGRQGRDGARGYEISVSIKEEGSGAAKYLFDLRDIIP